MIETMIRKLTTVALMAAVCMTAVAGSPTMTQSGPTEGSGLPAFGVVKVAGAMDDGVDVGDELCYRCKNKSRPQVVVFTHDDSDKTAMLIQKLDQAMTEHSDDQLRVFVNVLDADSKKAEMKAKKMADATGAKQVPFVVPSDSTGPRNYKLSDDAAVTITLANDSTVMKNISVTDASELDIDMVMNEVKRMLN